MYFSVGEVFAMLFVTITMGIGLGLLLKIWIDGQRGEYNEQDEI